MPCCNFCWSENHICQDCNLCYKCCDCYWDDDDDDDYWEEDNDDGMQ